MTIEVERCELLGIADLVVHPGSHMGEGPKAGLARVARGLDQVHGRTEGLNVTIDLETTAGQGTNLGHQFEHLREILDQVAHPERLGVCVDTCHIFAAGYSLGTLEEYDETIDRLDRSVGLDRLRVWHLNDSCRDCGSRVDRHAGIGAGRMGLEPFRHLVNDPRFVDVPMILETPKGTEDGEDLDARNLRILRHLVRRGAFVSQPRLMLRNQRLSRTFHQLFGADREPSSAVGRKIAAKRMVMSTTQLNVNGQVAVPAVAPSAVPLVDPSWFINRELSWLDFNERVLEEARDTSNPLLERLRFLAICASNLDEFFEVRVAGLQAQVYENLEPQDPPPDGMGSLAQLIEIARRAHDFVSRLYEVWLNELRPALLKHGIRVCASGRADRRPKRLPRRVFQHTGLPRLDAAGDRSGAPIPARPQQEPEPALAHRIQQTA